MGGCCCCASRRAESDSQPIYYYCPRNLEEHEPLSGPHVIPSAMPGGMFVATNLDTSNLDTYRAPPLPLPYDLDTARSHVLLGTCENSTKTDQGRQRGLLLSAGGTILGDVNSDGVLKQSELKKNIDKDDELIKAHKVGVFDNSLASTEEDICSICLEEYDFENPRILTKCEHHFHLACILEWMERSDNCPVCDKITMLDHDLGD